MKQLALRLALLAIAACPLAAGAQEFPSKPVRLIVPFQPGDPVDGIARVLAAQMGTELGRAIIVENRSGGSGVIGIGSVARAEPDGYTIGIATTGATAIIPSLLSTLPYDAGKDFAAITQVVEVPEALVARPKLGVHSFQELVQRAKKNPGALSFASTGNASLPHAAATLLEREAGIELNHVAYRGTAPAVGDLISGFTDLMFADLPLLLPHIQAGRLVALAIASAERADALPDVPTTREIGLPNVQATNWYLLIAPGGTPPAIVAVLNRAAVTALHSASVAAQLQVQGATAIGSSPEECAAFLRSETAKWGPVARAVRAQVE